MRRHGFHFMCKLILLFLLILMELILALEMGDFFAGDTGQICRFFVQDRIAQSNSFETCSSKRSSQLFGRIPGIR
jgi:hypothetical protein